VGSSSTARAHSSRFLGQRHLAEHVRRLAFLGVRHAEVVMSFAAIGFLGDDPFELRNRLIGIAAIESRASGDQ
jgi:hypothetical protein